MRNRKVNDAGRQAISDYLISEMKNPKNFDKAPDFILDGCVSIVEQKIKKGELPMLELGSHQTQHGFPSAFVVPNSGLDRVKP